MFERIIRFRYVLVIAVFFLLINSFAFLIAGVSSCIKGYISLYNSSFIPSETERPGLMLLEGLDLFMVSLVFMVFAFGIARLFLINNQDDSTTPKWLRINDLKGLKILLWETILVTLVVFCISHLIKANTYSLETLIFPGVILILALSLYLMKGKEE